MEEGLPSESPIVQLTGITVVRVCGARAVYLHSARGNQHAIGSAKHFIFDGGQPHGNGVLGRGMEDREETAHDHVVNSLQVSGQRPGRLPLKPGQVVQLASAFLCRFYLFFHTGRYRA